MEKGDRKRSIVYIFEIDMKKKMSMKKKNGVGSSIVLVILSF